MRRELAQLLGGGAVLVLGGHVHTTVTVYVKRRTRVLRRWVGLVGTEKEALDTVLREVRLKLGLPREGGGTHCRECPKRRGVQRHRAVRDGLCALHLSRREARRSQ